MSAPQTNEKARRIWFYRPGGWAFRKPFYKGADEYGRHTLVIGCGGWLPVMTGICTNCGRTGPIARVFANPKPQYCQGCWNPFGDLIGEES